MPIAPPVVGVFFIMSGYGLEYSFRKRGQEYLKGFFRKRLWKLLCPFLVTTVIYQVERLFLGLEWNSAEAWSGFAHGWFDAVFPLHTWFVFAIILFYGVFYLCFKHLKEKAALWAIFAFSVAYYVGMRFVLKFDVFWYNTSYMFLLGFLYCKYEERIKKCNVFVWLAAMFLLSLSIKGCSDYTDSIFIGAFAFVMVCGITLLDTHSKILASLGAVSFELYIVQGIPQIAFQNVGWNPWLAGVVIVMLDIVLAYAVHAIATYVQRTNKCIPS